MSAAPPPSKRPRLRTAGATGSDVWEGLPLAPSPRDPFESALWLSNQPSDEQSATTTSCPVCRAQCFGGEPGLHAHIKEQHTDILLPVSSLHCAVCHQEFATPSDTQRHCDDTAHIRRLVQSLLAMNGDDSHAQLYGPRIADNLRHTLSFLRPPDWPSSSAELEALSPEQLAVFPVGDFLDRYESQMQLFLSRCKTATLARLESGATRLAACQAQIDQLNSLIAETEAMQLVSQPSLEQRQRLSQLQQLAAESTSQQDL
eukprot:m.35372 g.35372  ORF g.35372 m.35372 type:complete len:259 (+) comp5717_c0_seq2:71-847(+)